ncbi:hypothetical protein FOMG_19437 [Fusarium oxysporum f. sp. melonis 26406]|uniref:Uncharacterized protein n=1 Tax=Fusarium oxysporum f. sp. melonis 26406 TaxID=1089452 RepID=W9Z6B0_FUSOX|nr:hypothetical protein FOMG_19437 [Fusarium oxysporum f. sp. melonis 26406]
MNNIQALSVCLDVRLIPIALHIGLTLLDVMTYASE